MSEKKAKTFRLMKAAIVPNRDQITLQSALTRRMQASPKVSQRLEHLDDDGNEVQFINQFSHEQAMAFGVMTGVIKGQHQMAIALDDPNATELHVEQVAPPIGNDKAKREFLDGVLYFGVKDNHIVIVGSREMRTANLQSHLNWLLKEGNRPQLKGNQSLVLVDPDTPARRKARNKSARSIRFKTELGDAQPYATGVQNAGQGHHEKTTIFKPAGQTWEGISNLLSGLGLKPPDIQFGEDVQPDDFQVLIELKTKRRKPYSEQGTPIIDPIANAFSHSPSIPVEIDFFDGTTLKNGDLKVSTVEQVECLGGIPRAIALKPKMMEWLGRILSSERIV